MDDQWDVITSEEQSEIKEAMKKSPAEGISKIKEYLHKENIPLNIAITGESGSGKSSFVNALRGIEDGDEGAAPTGVVETTKDVKGYPHPGQANVTLWDLPGFGTMKFPADKYLEKVGFEKFDFFFIISATRFTENDVKLAQEIKRMGKKFYFLRSKIDNDLSNEKKSRKRNFDKAKTLKVIKDDCFKSLLDQCIEDPQVFLVSSFELKKFDFHLLQETLERELPRHKRNALLYAMPNISMEIIKKKKAAYKAQIKYRALLSSAVAAVPIPGLSTVVDLTLILEVVSQYVLGFGLDEKSLERLAVSSGVPYSDLVSVMTSQLGATTISPELIKKVLSQLALEASIVVAEEVSRGFFVMGIPAAMCFSGIGTYRILNLLLDRTADAAQEVFEKAVKRNTEV